MSAVRLGITCLSLVSTAAFAQGGAAICGRISTNAELNQCTAAISGRRIEAAAVELCGRISTNQEIVQCARAVADHSIDPGAVQSCNRISTNQEIVSCARAIADKTYGQDELSLCDRNSTNQGIVDCMRMAGQRARVERNYDRRRRDYDRRDDDVQRAPEPASAKARVTIDNRSPSARVTRIYARWAGQKGTWSENLLSGRLAPGGRWDYTMEQGLLDICAEASDGSSTQWASRQLGEDGLYLTVDGPTNDANVWSPNYPCRGRDRR